MLSTYGWAAAPPRPTRGLSSGPDLLLHTLLKKNPKLLLICKHLECRKIMSQTLKPIITIAALDSSYPPPAPPQATDYFEANPRYSFISFIECLQDVFPGDKASFKILQIYIIALSLLKIVIIFNVIKYPIGIHLSCLSLGFLFSTYLNRDSNKA